jgi:hypothetical protein
VAERNGLLNRRTGNTVPWVRIPLSPQKVLIIYYIIPNRQGACIKAKWYNISLSSSGCSVARLSRLVWDQEVASSNLAIPTLSVAKQINGP